jgi:WD repeat-containing protein 68
MPLLDILTRPAQKENVSSLGNNYTFAESVYSMSLKRSKLLVGTLVPKSNENYIYCQGRKYFHRLPPTKVAWCPKQEEENLFASTSTSLRIWKSCEEKPLMKLQTSSKNTGSSLPAPITSFDWNPVISAKIATSAVDTTISIWDIEKGKMETQLIAHDKPVFDVAYGNANQFASVSEDGSLRLFDVRDLDHSTILYEDSAPFLRLVWNINSAPNYIATISADSVQVSLFDLRKSGFLVTSLTCGSASPNALGWGPNQSLAVGLGDGSCIVFDASSGSQRVVQPPTSYSGGGVVNVCWAGEGTLGLAHNNQVSIKSLS